jgi:prolipoprotein diacylglyceryl transferase
MRADIADLFAPSWFTCVGLAGLVGLILMVVLARRRGIDTGTVGSAVLWGYVAAVGAGIVVPMTIDAVGHLFATGQFHLRWAGMTSFWGYLGGAVAVVFVCRRDGLSLARFGDLAAIPLGVALVFARLGCFMAGCDYGKVTSLPWAVRFPAGSPAWRDHIHGGLIPADRAASLPVHPTQLYEALLGLAIVGIAIFFARRKRADGHVFLVVAATYAIGRLVIESLRGDAGRGIYAGLSSGQIFSMLVLVAIAAGLFLTKRRAVLAAVATTLVLSITNVGEADAQPAPSDPQPQEPYSQQQVDPQEPFPDVPPPPAPAPLLNERPLFSTGVLFGIASPINRRAGQIPTMAGPTLSIGWMPGRWGVWADFDSYSSSEAKHSTLIASASYSRRPRRNVMFGVRTGIGVTLVNFKDPAFGDVAAKTVRLEAIAEYAFMRHWALWVRPLAIDMVSASELGGPITTFQFRVGVAYRFGSRHNAIPVQPLPPLEPPPPPPPTGPTLDPDPAPEVSAAP